MALHALGSRIRTKYTLQAFALSRKKTVPDHHPRLLRGRDRTLLLRAVARSSGLERFVCASPVRLGVDFNVVGAVVFHRDDARGLRDGALDLAFRREAVGLPVFDKGRGFTPDLRNHLILLLHVLGRIRAFLGRYRLGFAGTAYVFYRPIELPHSLTKDRPVLGLRAPGKGIEIDPASNPCAEKDLLCERLKSPSLHRGSSIR